MHHPTAITHDAHALFSELVSDCPPVDLTLPYQPYVEFETPKQFPRRTQDFVEDAEDEYGSDGDSTQPTPLLPAKRRATEMQSPEQRRRDHHNTHTRRCRARLNWRFDALNRMLPAPENSEVKHKVHILDHSIMALKSLQAEIDQLRLLVAIRSNAAMLDWIDSFAPQAANAVVALKPVLDMLTFVGGWPYAEIWARKTGQKGGMEMQHFAVKSSALLEPALSTLGRHCLQGQSVCEESELVGQVFLNGSAKWCEDIVEQCRDGLRRQMLSNGRLRTCLAVPVAIDGEISHVIAVYDIRERAEDSKMMEFASFMGVMVGNAFGAARAQLEYEARSKVPTKTGRSAPKTPKISPKTTKVKA